MIVKDIKTSQPYAHVARVDAVRLSEAPYLQYVALVVPEYDPERIEPLILMRGKDEDLKAFSQKEIAACQKRYAGVYDLPHMQLAQNAVAYHKTDQNIADFIGFVEDFSTYFSTRLAGTGVLVAALATGCNHVDNKSATEAFSEGVPKSAQGVEFRVDVARGVVATGNPDKAGVQWIFENEQHQACAFQPAQVKKESLMSLSLIDKAYDRDCRSIGSWPAGSMPLKLYEPAYTAYLQTARPGTTPQDAQKALAAYRTYQTFKP